MALARRAASAPAAAAAPPPPAAKPNGNVLNFGDLSFYTSGGFIPEGDYVWTKLRVVLFQAQTQAGVSKGPVRLGVQITMRPLNNPTAESEHQQFYSMGSQADKSFAPNPQTGTGLVAVPGGPGASLNDRTNWAILLQSLYNSGLPQGIFQNDLTVLEGMWVHMMNVPEPEERKSFGNTARTGEAAEEPRRDAKIAVVSEIKDDGKPWEGTGGIPEAKPNGQAALKATAAAPASRPVAAAAASEPQAAPAPRNQEAEAAASDVYQAALDGIEAVLTASPNGVSRLALRSGTFRALKNAVSEDMAQAVIETYFMDDSKLTPLLTYHGYGIAGGQVKPVA